MPTMSHILNVTLAMQLYSFDANLVAMEKFNSSSPITNKFELHMSLNNS